MSIHEKIADGFRQLIQEGRQFGERGSNADYIRFRAQAMNLIRRSCGEGSDHYQELKRLAEDAKTTTNPYYLRHCLGAVEAAHRDFEAGLLFDVRSLVAAELLGGFMDQAETLLAAGYHVPAASLSGAILEDAMRKLCEKNNINYPAKSGINSLNAELARNNIYIYDKLIMKRITAIADIRNSADHGNFEQFAKEDVTDMVKWIGRFTSDYLQ
jgi:hypothetical protein